MAKNRKKGTGAGSKTDSSKQTAHLTTARDAIAPRIAEIEAELGLSKAKEAAAEDFVDVANENNTEWDPTSPEREPAPEIETLTRAEFLERTDIALSGDGYSTTLASGLRSGIAQATDSKMRLETELAEASKDKQGLEQELAAINDKLTAMENPNTGIFSSSAKPNQREAARLQTQRDELEKNIAAISSEVEYLKNSIKVTEANIAKSEAKLKLIAPVKGAKTLYEEINDERPASAEGKKNEREARAAEIAAKYPRYAALKSLEGHLLAGKLDKAGVVQALYALWHSEDATRSNRFSSWTPLQIKLQEAIEQITNKFDADANKQAQLPEQFRDAASLRDEQLQAKMASRNPIELAELVAQVRKLKNGPSLKEVLTLLPHLKTPEELRVVLSANNKGGAYDSIINQIPLFRRHHLSNEVKEVKAGAWTTLEESDWRILEAIGQRLDRTAERNRQNRGVRNQEGVFTVIYGEHSADVPHSVFKNIESFIVRAEQALDAYTRAFPEKGSYSDVDGENGRVRVHDLERNSGITQRALATTDLSVSTKKANPTHTYVILEGKANTPSRIQSANLAYDTARIALSNMLANMLLIPPNCIVNPADVQLYSGPAPSKQKITTLTEAVVNSKGAEALKVLAAKARTAERAELSRAVAKAKAVHTKGIDVTEHMTALDHSTKLAEIDIRYAKRSKTANEGLLLASIKAHPGPTVKSKPVQDTDSDTEGYEKVAKKPEPSSTIRDSADFAVATAALEHTMPITQIFNNGAFGPLLGTIRKAYAKGAEGTSIRSQIADFEAGKLPENVESGKKKLQNK